MRQTACSAALCETRTREKHHTRVVGSPLVRAISLALPECRRFGDGITGCGRASSRAPAAIIDFRSATARMGIRRRRGAGPGKSIPQRPCHGKTSWNRGDHQAGCAGGHATPQRAACACRARARAKAEDRCPAPGLRPRRETPHRPRRRRRHVPRPQPGDHRRHGAGGDQLGEHHDALPVDPRDHRVRQGPPRGGLRTPPDAHQRVEALPLAARGPLGQGEGAPGRARFSPPRRAGDGHQGLGRRGGDGASRASAAGARSGDEADASRHPHGHHLRAARLLRRLPQGRQRVRPALHDSQAVARGGGQARPCPEDGRRPDRPGAFQRRRGDARPPRRRLLRQRSLGRAEAILHGPDPQPASRHHPGDRPPRLRRR